MTEFFFFSEYAFVIHQNKIIFQRLSLQKRCRSHQSDCAGMLPAVIRF